MLFSRSRSPIASSASPIMPCSRRTSSCPPLQLSSIRSLHLDGALSSAMQFGHPRLHSLVRTIARCRSRPPHLNLSLPLKPQYRPLSIACRSAILFPLCSEALENPPRTAIAPDVGSSLVLHRVRCPPLCTPLWQPSSSFPYHLQVRQTHPFLRRPDRRQDRPGLRRY